MISHLLIYVCPFNELDNFISRAFSTGSHEIYQAIEAAYKNIEAVGFKNFDYYFELSGVVATGTTPNLAWPFDTGSLDDYHMEVLFQKTF